MSNTNTNTSTSSTVTDQDVSNEDKTHIRRLQALRRTGAVNMFVDLRRGLHLLLTDDAAEATFEWVRENLEYYLRGDWVHVSVTDESDVHDGAYLREEERDTDEIIGSVMEDLTVDEMRHVADINRDDPEWLPDMLPADYNVLVDECRYELRELNREHGGDEEVQDR